MFATFSAAKARSVTVIWRRARLRETAYRTGSRSAPRTQKGPPGLPSGPMSCVPAAGSAGQVGLRHLRQKGHLEDQRAATAHPAVKRAQKGPKRQVILVSRVAVDRPAEA